MIPYGRQDITQADIDAVTAVLKSDFLTQGPIVPMFEEAVANIAGAKHGVATNSATSALHVACLAIGLQTGDVLWTSPITFVASANCGLYCGATVDFVDIDPDTFNMCPDKLAEKLTVAARDGVLPKVIIPVHMCGQSCDMQKIHELAQSYGVRIIEDASHAIGGTYKQHPIGACIYSDITVFSFHPVKIVTTAEGGVAVTNDLALAERMQQFRSHGITRDPEKMTQVSDGPWYYQQVLLGYNYRITEMQAALGLSQLERLHKYIERRHELATVYDAALKEMPVLLPEQRAYGYSAYHLYVIRMKDQHGRGGVFDTLRAKGVGVNVHYIPVHLQPYYRNTGFSVGDFPVAEQYYDSAISLPLYPSMTGIDQKTVIESVKEAMI